MKQAGIKITYAGVDISQWMYVRMVERNVGTNHVSKMQKVGISDGQMLQYMSRDVKTIVVTGIVMNDDLVPLRRSLAAAIDTDKPQQLIFGDEPDKYYLAIIDSQPTFTEGFRSGTVSISFICPDGGIAHSVATKTFDNMPYKNYPVNQLRNTGFGRKNDSDWDPSIWSTDGAVTKQDGIVTSVNTGKSIIQHTVSQSESSWIKSGMTVTISVYVKGKGSVTSGYFNGSDWEEDSQPQQADFDDYVQLNFTRVIKAVHLGAGSPRFSINTFCPNSTMQTKLLKVELGTTYSTWSPNPADPEYYSDTITVTNSGTVPVPVKVTSKFSSDDGFLGLTLNGRYYQVGNTKEVNGITYDDSQMLVKTRPTIDKYILNDPSFAVIPADQGVMTQTGTVTIKPDPTNQLGITTPSDFGPNNHGPHGPSLIYKLPADSNGEVGAVNCILRMHAGLGALSLDSPSDTRQVGQICMTIYDANKNAMARILYSDMSQTTSDFTVRYDLNGTKVHEEDFSNTPGFTGHCYIRKSGSQFIFAWGGEAGGTAQTYTCEEFADTKVMYVSFNFLQWADVPLPHYFGLIEWNFEKDYVDLYKDLPNYFKAGDIVTLDSSTNLLKINQYTDWDRVDIGSQPLLAPPGQSKLGIVVSPWANLPAVSTELREGWL